MSEENPNTPPATPPTPEWKAIAPNFNSEVELANSYKSAAGELTRAKQELAALKSQPKSEESPGWDWQDPNKIWDSTGEQFNPEWVKFVGESTKAPEPVLQELLDTVVKARGIIKESSKTKWDTVAGFENSQKQVLEYLGKTYQGQALQERLSDLEHPRYWENALKDTLQEMQVSNGSPSNEPSPLPNVQPHAGGIVPLDPQSREATDLFGDPKYGYDIDFQRVISDRIRAFRKTQR